MKILSGALLTIIWVVCTSSVIYVLPDSSSAKRCPTQPCATLSQYLLDNNGTLPVIDNVEYHLLPGEHHVQTMIELYGLFNLTFFGLTRKGLLPVVIIGCFQPCMHIIDSKHVVVKNIIFQQCNLLQKDYNYVYETNLILTECWSCKIVNITFLQYGLVANNLLGESRLHNIVIILTTKRSTAYLYYHGLFLTYKDSSNISFDNYFTTLDTINIYSQKNDTVHVPFINSAPECIVIRFQQTVYNVTIRVNNSHFHNVYQKVLLVNAVSCFAYISVLIENCVFESISQYTVTQNAYMISIKLAQLNKMLSISNCKFLNNNNFHRIIGITTDTEVAYSFNSDVRYMNHNLIIIKACTIANIVKCGFLLMQVEKGYLGYKTNALLLRPIKLIRILKADVLLYFSGVNVQITGPLMMSEIHTIILLTFKTSDVIFGGLTIIDSCTCNTVIFLHVDSVHYIKLSQYTNITIFNCTIQKEIINVDRDRYSSPYPYCTFQFITAQNTSTPLALLRNYQIIFDNNFVSDAKKKACRNFFHHHSSHCRWINASIFHGYDSTFINKQIIQDETNQTNEHMTICLHSNNTTDCKLDVLGHVYPGQTLQVELCVPCSLKQLPATLLVESHNRLLPSTSCKVVHQNQFINLIKSYSRVLNFTVTSNSTDSCELFLTVSPFANEVYEVFHVKLRPCPIGFVLQNGKCDCDPVLVNNRFLQIKNCEIDQLTIKRPPNSWITPLTSDNSTYLLCSNCPMDYCLPFSSDLNLQNSDLQCQFNRTGILCSQCQHSLSMAFGSSRCIHCTNIHVLISMVILLAGLALVVALYILNLTVTNGSITGIIFYANVININDSTFLVNDNIFKPLRVFISFVNLDLGIEMCFYNGMDSYAKIFFQLFFPLYIITIAILIIVISHYSPCLLRWTYAKSFSVLATLLLLSYSGTLRTVVTVLFYYSIIVQLPSGDKVLVWSVDPSVQLFALKFIFLFITCLLILLILFSFNILLFFAPYLSKFPSINCLRLLLNAFKSPYKCKYYYWMGIKVTLQAFFLILQAVPTKIKLIMSTIVMVTFTLLLGSLRPHKSNFTNAQELLLLLNLTILYAVSYQDDSKLFSIITNIMVSLALIQFCVIVLCHLLTNVHFCRSRIMKTLKHKLIK